MSKRSILLIAPILWMGLVLVPACSDNEDGPLEPPRDAAPRFVKEWAFEGNGRGEFGGVFGLAIDSSGVIYAADAYRYKIQVFSREGERLGEIVKPDENEAPWPAGMAVSIDGDLLVAAFDTGPLPFYGQIQRFRPDGTLLQRWGHEGGPGQKLDDPVAIAVDREGFIYVADNTAHRIVKYTSDGVFVKNWRAGPPRSGRRHWGPHALAITPQNTLVMTEWHGFQITEYSLEGDSLTQWSEFQKLNNTYGIAVDARGDQYVADYTFSHVVKFTSEGNFLVGTSKPFEDVEGGLIFPDQVALFRDKELYVLDRSREKILKFELD